MTRNVLLVGSLGLPDVDTAFRKLAATVGAHAPRYPDGEPGERCHWVLWQERAISQNPAFEQFSEAEANETGVPTRTRRKRPDVEWTDVRIESLGYAHEAINAYSEFSSMKSAGIIPADTRLQVSLPTPTAFLTTFIAASDAAQCESIYEEAMKREIEEMAANIPNAELAIQWDVCHEVIAQDGGMTIFYEPTYDAHMDRLARLCGYVPDGVELGIHLCYGDPGHKHVIEPETLETCVAFTNGLISHSPRQIDWVHMPVPRDRDDSEYFRPLLDLKAPEKCEIYLGLLHYTDGEAGAKKRMETADNYLTDYGIATECGFGRRDTATIEPLLSLHKAVAEQS